MFDQAVIEASQAVAERLGIDLAALLAIAEIESGGTAFALIDGHREPLIRFEGHYFDQRLDGALRQRARALGLASPVAGAVANPRRQADRWALLEKAAALDRRAAYESVSWGLGQVMGAHWKWLGFADVEGLVLEARGGVAGQIALMARYIEKAGLAAAVRERDWERFARGYNGPDHARGRYHIRIAEAHRRYSGNSGASLEAAKRPPDRRAPPDDAEFIRDLQRMLSATGHPTAIDGLNGPATTRAVRSFQKEQGLAVDGIAGPETLAALRSGLPLGALHERLWVRIIAFLRRLSGRGD